MDEEYGISESASRSIADIYKYCKKEADLQKKKEKKTFRIDTLSELDNVIPFEVRNLVLTYEYQGKFPELEKFPNLKSFNSFVSAPIKRYTEMDMSQIEELYIAVSDMEDIEIYAPQLKKLDISINYNPIEMQEKESPINESIRQLRILGALQIQELRLSHFDGYDLSWIGCLSNLKSLCIRYTRVDDLSWLLTCIDLESLFVYGGSVQVQTIPPLSNLKSLTLCGCALESIRELPYFPNLSHLNLGNNNISEIKVPEKLEHINVIDLRKNPIADSGEIRGIRRSRLILNSIDEVISNLEKENSFNGIFQRAYNRCVNEYKNPDNYAPFIRNKILSSTPEERFELHVNEEFGRTFFGLSPDQAGSDDYNTIEKEKMIEAAEENYPFIEIKKEYLQQIEYEKLGIQSFFKEGCGRIIFVNQGIYCITAQFNPNAKRSEIHFKHPNRQYLSWREVMQFMDPKGQNEIFNQYRFYLEVFDLYRTGNAQKLSLGIQAAIESLLEGIVLTSDIFVAGEYSTVGNVKRDPISKKWLPIAKRNGAKKIVNISKGKAGERVEDGIQWIYGVGFDYLSDVGRKNCKAEGNEHDINSDEYDSKNEYLQIAMEQEKIEAEKAEKERQVAMEQEKLEAEEREKEFQEAMRKEELKAHQIFLEEKAKEKARREAEMEAREEERAKQKGKLQTSTKVVVSIIVKILLWAITIFCVLFGISCLATGYIAWGIICVLLAIIACPLITSKTKDIAALNGYYRYKCIIAVVLVVLFFIFAII